ncbi:hypothetical protein [Kitasatospora sp. NBC_01266]|uniref:hypothetical protein n=1 Tax=Kitasatospora sp. NBC_01266 TaxID=2903572 RepID=UPI002E30730E|nr:hypothetical protein [Kitasatospora sp. NBC_01266]
MAAFGVSLVGFVLGVEGGLVLGVGLGAVVVPDRGAGATFNGSDLRKSAITGGGDRKRYRKGDLPERSRRAGGLGHLTLFPLLALTVLRGGFLAPALLIRFPLSTLFGGFLTGGATCCPGFFLSLLGGLGVVVGRVRV